MSVVLLKAEAPMGINRPKGFILCFIMTAVFFHQYSGAKGNVEAEPARESIGAVDSRMLRQ